MKLNVTILSVKTVNQLDSYWTTTDYKNLLQEFDYGDVDEIPENELLDYLKLCISDVDPAEAAVVVLTYKVGDRLNAGQIENLSHEMQEDKIAEDYSDPALHFDLFNVNQLLYKAFNGTFPNTEASIINISITPVHEKLPALNKEILIKALSAGLVANNIINRLYTDELNGKEPFDQAAKMIWNFKTLPSEEIEIITSKYFIEKLDFKAMEYEANIVFHEED